jgi:CotH kinase protein
MRHETILLPRSIHAIAAVAVAVAYALLTPVLAQVELAAPPPAGQDAPPSPPDGFRPPGGPGFGGFGGPGGPRGPMGEERKILKDFDKNGDKRLNVDERQEAREFLKKNPGPRSGFRRGGGAGGGPDGNRPAGGFGPPPGFGGGENQEPPKPGVQVLPSDVPAVQGRDFYAADTLRTLFLDFERDDWEKELEDFHGTDVEVPATLTVDGVKYPGVGVHFRGASSYMMVREGRKRSLNVSVDFTEKKQRLEDYKTLNLMNCAGDASYMSAVLYSHIARQYMPAPKANFVRVVINGESWGLYANVQQFNKDFIQENYRTSKGARWKVKGSPGGQSGLDYVGDDIAEYKKRYELKDGDEDDWRALIAFCKTLSETPLDQLEKALSPIMDIDEVLWFLALDISLLNSDGYWIRASDYSLYRDKDGKFHVIPGDINEAFRAEGGPGRRVRRINRPDGPEGAPIPDAPVASTPPAVEPAPQQPERGLGVEVDPLYGMDDVKKPLRSRLLAVPELRKQYLNNVRRIADEWLDWNKLRPLVAQYRALIEKEVEADTRKIGTFATFQAMTSDTTQPQQGEARGRGPGGGMNFREFADKRRAYLLSLTEKLQAEAK